jgi:diacylglycerol kinase family enzyme
LVACRVGRHVRDRRLVYLRGREVRVETDRPQRYQLDGDPPEPMGDEDDRHGTTADLRISLHPNGLGVLLP